MSHSPVNRTSPKGTPFIGTCAACGKRDLTWRDVMNDDCPNPRLLTQEGALIEAIEGEDA